MSTPLPVSALHHKIANGRVCLLYDAKNDATTGCFLLTGSPNVVFIFCAAQLTAAIVDSMLALIVSHVLDNSKMFAKEIFVNLSTIYANLLS